MKRLNTLTKACKPIASRHNYLPIRALSTAPSTATLRTPTRSTLRTTTTTTLNHNPSQTTRRHASTPADSSPLSKTPLYDFHIANGAKMVPFSGFHMPVQYDSLSVSESHHFTRSNCSLFDVSHMVQHRFSGPGATAFLEKITPAGIRDLKVHTAGLSTLLLPETGGIVDDTIITRLGPELFYVVTNAGCREKDLKYLGEQLEVFRGEGKGKVDWEVLDGWGLIAIQGPKSEDVLASVLVTPTEENLRGMFFGQSKFIKVRLPDGKVSSPLLVSRAGYTGEDGFEISIPESETVDVTKALLEGGGKDMIALAGLGARDSLRLEAGMCLYGHDLDETVTPVEASLSWIIGKDRKIEGGFHGDKVILAQLKPKSKGGMGVERRRVGIVVEGAPAREGAEILGSDGNKIGTVTSGCPSPSLKKNIAMGYVKDGFHKAGTEVDVVVRGKKRRGVVTKMPFVPTQYWKGAAPA